MITNLVADISQIIQSFKDSLRSILPGLEQEVGLLIEANSKDSRKIEHYLDTLLSLTTMNIADDLFIKLLEYYKTLDEEGAEFYWNEYDTDE